MSNTSTYLMLLYYTERQSSHNLKYTMGHTYTVTVAINSNAHDHIHVSMLMVQISEAETLNSLKLLKNAQGNRRLATVSHGCTQIWDGSCRTGAFRLTPITMGLTPSSVTGVSEIIPLGQLVSIELKRDMAL